MSRCSCGRPSVSRRQHVHLPSPPEEIERYRDRHWGERILIIGNGPSVVGHDLTRAHCPTIGLNQAWRLRKPSGSVLRLTYYCMGDQGQFRTYQEEQGDISTLAPLWATHTGPEHAIRVKSLPVAGRKRFSFDLARKGVYCNNTVTAYGIQLAVYMGASEICLVGIDAKGKHFYGGNDVPESKFANQRETFGYIAGVLEYARPDIRILNLTPGTAVMVFERAKFDDLFP